jgi:3-dehydroquinate dehydratase II
MKHIYIINGPNLNLLGTRQPEVYGTMTLDAVNINLRKFANDLHIQVTFFQSNHEGDLIDYLHQANKVGVNGVILNAGAYTHYSYALHDAILSIKVPVVEVHFTDIYSRKETWRHQSVIQPVVVKQCLGKGVLSYQEALQYFSQEK